MTTTQNYHLKTIDLNIKLRLATKQDFRLWSGSDLVGFQYFLYSSRLNKIQGPYYVEQWTNRKNFNNWFTGGIMYVICNLNENWE